MMNYFHERNVKQSKLAKYIDFFEEYGNSIALYVFLILLGIGIWIVSPIPSPNWNVNGKVVGWASVFFVFITTLHGILWFIITRESLKLSSKTKKFLSTSIKIVKPLHMNTGMIGLGLAFMHGFAYLSVTSFQNIYIVSGLTALLSLLILTIDGIGLMVSPFLSRKVHRWIAVVFLLSLIVHLSIIFT